MNKSKVKNIIIYLVYIVAGIAAIYYIHDNVAFTPGNDVPTVSEETSITDSVTVMATGDIMYHMPQYRNNYDSSLNKYRFDTFYEKMKPYFNEADIVVGNYETTSNPERAYSGFPCFNTPPESIEDLKKSGFDVLSTANNHCIDTGKDGIISTIDIMDRNGIQHFGTYKENQDRGIIVERNNIKIGFLGYSELFNGMDSLISENEKYMISYFDLDGIKKDVQSLKDRGANIIICYPHWGVEFSKSPSSFQKYMNQELLNSGIDIVLGSHPHVLQRAELTENNGKKQFTIYSMGNSISNQRTEWMNIKGVESGVFVKLLINKNRNSNTAVLENVELIPTYVNRYRENGKFFYEVIPYQDIAENGKYRDILDSSTKNKVDKYYEEALNTLNSAGE